MQVLIPVLMPVMTALICGLLFGAGLLISQMVNPAKVLNFLDISGNWDPSLALVMASALTVFSLGYFFVVKKSKKPLLAPAFIILTNKHIDKPLLVGAAIFGLGWGLAGICPGPAMVNLSGGDVKIFAFIAMMLAGNALSGLIFRFFKPKQAGLI